MNLLIRWLLNTVALGITAYLLEGIKVSGFGAALAAALVLGIVNAVIRPLFIILTLPLNFLTLGLFTFVINGIMLKLAAALVPGFEVRGFLTAVFGSILLSIASFILTSLVKD
ncbi:MAG: phage holin family protein [Peptococcaceae bacterium]|jgi:putative membrane protein|nr:phage holin family protein [Peptococcaceae bacterium]MDH7524759.1 phage holin family protein [Peptococcaceae bacterium]